jgi:hypothetical protein
LDFHYSFNLGGNHRLSSAYFGPEEVVRAHSLDRVLSATASHIERTVAEHAPGSTFIHAGVIGWGGQAIVFPGRSCTGKSSLVRALLRLGAAYFSDEFAVVDSEGLVHPFARPLSLRSPSGRAILDPDQIGAKVGFQPLAVGAVVITHYAPNGIWQPVLISRGHAVLELLRNTVAVRSNPARSMENVLRAMRSSIALKSTRGEAEMAALLVSRTLDEYKKPRKRR